MQVQIALSQNTAYYFLNGHCPLNTPYSWHSRTEYTSAATKAVEDISRMELIHNSHYAGIWWGVYLECIYLWITRKSVIIVSKDETPSMSQYYTAYFSFQTIIPLLKSKKKDGTAHGCAIKSHIHPTGGWSFGSVLEINPLKGKQTCTSPALQFQRKKFSAQIYPLSPCTGIYTHKKPTRSYASQNTN